MSGAVEVYIGLGSNLGRPRRELLAALEALARLPGYTPGGVSSPYLTAPVGPQDQPPFVNAVARGMFEGEATELLGALLEVERQRGRVRDRRWGPRILDLDLLLFGDQVIDLPQLKVPHPEMFHRAFVLVPLMELAPELVLPVWKRTAARLYLEMDPAEKAAQRVEKTTWGSGGS